MQRSTPTYSPRLISQRRITVEQLPCTFVADSVILTSEEIKGSKKKNNSLEFSKTPEDLKLLGVGKTKKKNAKGRLVPEDLGLYVRNDALSEENLSRPTFLSNKKFIA